MSGATSRLRSLLGHIGGSGPASSDGTSSSSPSSSSSSAAAAVGYEHSHHIHQLSPTFFLERAAAIEPDAPAIHHVTANGAELRRSYAEFADRARGLGYFLRRRRLRRVGVLATNTPAFLESIFGIVAAGGVVVPVNYRLKADDVTYIFDYAEVDSIIVDNEYLSLLDDFKKSHPNVLLIVDLDTDQTEGQQCGPFNEAVLEGLRIDESEGGRGWAGLHSQCANEDDMIAIPFTSGTTSKPKGCVYTHRGAYLAALANVVESGLNYHRGRCKYLWTLPMFHAMGWTFPWAVTAVRGTHYCLRKVDYPLIWRLLKEEGITHYAAAPTVNTLLCAADEAAPLPHPVRVTVAASPPTAHLFEQMIKLNLHPVHVYGMTETYGPITKGYHLPAWDELPAPERYARMARQGHGFLASLPIRVVRRTPPDEQQQQQQEEEEEAGATGGDALALVDVARDGREIGEIVFCGNICAAGYYRDAAATRALFAGGALHSGDLAVVHPDGSAQVQDRAKDIIISGGENISSVALEGVLVQHPDVLEAGVVAVPDARWGERPKAYVTAREGGSSGGGLDPAAVVAWARDHRALSRYAVPREVEVVRELPKTSTGKIQKNVLREWSRRSDGSDGGGGGGGGDGGGSA